MQREPIDGGGAALRRALLWTVAALVFTVHSAWLSVADDPTLFYAFGVLAHVLGGALLAGALGRLGLGAARAVLRRRGAAGVAALAALVLFAGGCLAGILLAVVGNTRDTAWLLQAHELLSVLAAPAALAALWLAPRQGAGPRRVAWIATAGAAAAATVFAVGDPLGLAERDPRITNTEIPPPAMEYESMGGADGPFFPSAAFTSTGGRIPSDFFLKSEGCGRSGCHPDILEQWKGSAHHFSSFNNQWYRKSIEYMQEVNSIQSSRWCGGCHDHAVLFNGMMDRPIEEILDTPEAQAGLGCNSCHAIVGVRGTMGNGGFHIEYPPLHDMAVSENPVLRFLHDLSIHLDPGPHRKVFLKPFHRESQAEFCSSCHKVHLDAPVNNYRWLRGFNEYDNWQASGVSGEGARSFYYPPQPKVCGDCHMVPVPSDDKGNRDGVVHDHSFAAANTAVPVSHRRGDQLRRAFEFLQKGAVTVDLFAAGPARAADARIGEAAPGEPELASTFAVGEEAAAPLGRRPVPREPLAPVWAPLERSGFVLRRGAEARIDVVVRTRDLGHFFPGGTVDAFDVWLELRASGADGRIFYWSGPALDGGRGPVHDGAHFYRSLMVDGRGNPINKRNAWATRAVVYVNLIPPGAADVAHFRLAVPDDVEGPVTLEARLNYRKFTHYNTAFSFAGRPADAEPAGPGPGQDRVTKHWDDREFVFDDVPADVSAERPEIPDLPIVVMDRRTVVLPVAGTGDAPAPNAAEPRMADRERWNDYGIGLLRRGDLKGAERAFLQVTAIDPQYADGFVNVARARLREGTVEGAVEMLRRALEIRPELAAAHYFLGVARKEQGDYDGALEHLLQANRAYPRDRVVLNAIGRVHFLRRDYSTAVAWLQRVLDVDAEDLMAHYNLMLSYRGLGEARLAETHRRLYERFKADEDSQILTGDYRRKHPHDNRERQPVHEHPSAPADLIAAEQDIRASRGEPLVVLPGQAEAWVERFLAAGDVASAARQPDAGGGAAGSR